MHRHGENKRIKSPKQLKRSYCVQGKSLWVRRETERQRILASQPEFFFTLWVVFSHVHVHCFDAFCFKKWRWVRTWKVGDIPLWIEDKPLAKGFTQSQSLNSILVIACMEKNNNGTNLKRCGEEDLDYGKSSSEPGVRYALEVYPLHYPIQESSPFSPPACPASSSTAGFCVFLSPVLKCSVFLEVMLWLSTGWLGND